MGYGENERKYTVDKVQEGHRLVEVHSNKHRQLTGALGDTDGSVLIFGVRVGLHLKRLLVIDQSLGTLGHTGSRVVEKTTRLYRYTQTHTHTLTFEQSL